MAIWPSKRCTGLLTADREPVRASPGTIYRFPGIHSAETSCSPNHHAASRTGDKQQSGSKWVAPTDAFTQPPPDVIDPDDTETND